MSQEMLATDARLQTAHVSRIERSLANPTLEVLCRVARALKVDVCALLASPKGSSAVANLKRGRKRIKAVAS